MALRIAFESGQPHSCILWGPPGTGKTTIARLMADSFDAQFITISAVLAAGSAAWRDGGLGRLAYSKVEKALGFFEETFLHRRVLVADGFGKRAEFRLLV